MMTAAISEPTEAFDGKVGLIFHGDIIPAHRDSQRRPRGTLEIHPKNINCDEFINGQIKVSSNVEDCGIIDQIIQKKQPETFTYIQMDNASPHVGEDTMERLNEYCDKNNLMMEYRTQPAQSPDFNICDLAIFNSLQKRVDRIKEDSDRSLESLWEITKKVFDDYPKETIEICYGHLYANYNECLLHHGDNRYKNPHNQIRSKYARGESLNK
jgi:hypothetical protein